MADFQPRAPKPFANKHFGTSGLKIGAPQKCQIQPRRIQPLLLGPLNDEIHESFFFFKFSWILQPRDLPEKCPNLVVSNLVVSGFLKRALAQTCLRAWYQVRFFDLFLGILGALCTGKGGAPGTVPLHNLRVTSHVLHREVPLGWYRVRLF